MNFSQFSEKFRSMLNHENAAKLLLRICAGGLMLFHGIAKVSNDQAIGYIKSSLAGLGLPEFIAYGVFLGEVIAPLMILLGIAARLGGIILSGNMVFALLLAHRTNLFSLSEGGALSVETALFYLLLGLCVAFLGSGKYSLNICPKWN